jgi:predicted flavoprotein YhiN
MCAATAGQRGRRVALLEHGGQAGRKILISGGGRCNFTNLHCGPGNFISENRHFAKSALAGYGPQEFLALVERYGIAWHEKTLGQLFCDGSARAILEMLLAECELGGVELVLNAREIAVERDDGSGGFRITSSAGEFSAESVVVATGGLSIPKMGATGLGYEIARQFGMKVIAPRPGLVPLVLSGDEAQWTELAGVAAEVVAWTEPGRPSDGMWEEHTSGAKARPPLADSMSGINPGPTARRTFPDGMREEDTSGAEAHVDFVGSMRGLKPPPPSEKGSATPRKTAAFRPVSFREKMLVTHRGVSGPAVLQASSYWRAGEEIVFDFGPGRKLLAALMEPAARRDLGALKQALREVLPQRLAGFLAEQCAPAGWGNAALEECERRLHRYALRPVGTEGFEKAEVTAGGVDTDGLNGRTMEARAVPGLYFIGEAVDVTGWLGGFNFQWAWASGVAAGKVA